MQKLDNESAGLKINTLAELFAIKSAAYAAAESSSPKRSVHVTNSHLIPNLQAQANRRQYQFSTIGMSLANHRYCQGPILLNNNGNFAYMAKDGSPLSSSKSLPKASSSSCIVNTPPTIEGRIDTPTTQVDPSAQFLMMWGTLRHSLNPWRKAQMGRSQSWDYLQMP